MRLMFEGQEGSMNRRGASLSIYFLIFMLVMIIVLLSCKAFTYADESVDPSRTKCYRSITIYYGDTLPAIAGENIPPEYSDLTKYIQEIAFINQMNIDDTLIPGNHLIIPYYTASN